MSIIAQYKENHQYQVVRLFLSDYLVENIFSNIEESVLTEEQKAQVEAQHELYKQGKLKLIPLAQFRENVKKTHGI